MGGHHTLRPLFHFIVTHKYGVGDVIFLLPIDENRISSPIDGEAGSRAGFKVGSLTPPVGFPSALSPVGPGCWDAGQLGRGLN